MAMELAMGMKSTVSLTPTRCWSIVTAMGCRIRSSAASVPTIFRGAIGIHFVSQNDLDGTINTNETTGVVPQTRWNETLAIRAWTRPSGSIADIAYPAPGRIV